MHRQSGFENRMFENEEKLTHELLFLQMSKPIKAFRSERRMKGEREKGKEWNKRERERKVKMNEKR